MKLEGSCHCGKVKFSLESREPWPYQRCYCSVCRKTSGGGGYSINIGGDASSLVVTGREHVKVYRAIVERDGKRVQSEHERHFCGECGSPLWASNPSWPDLVHPVASAVDTELPAPPEHVHLMVGSKAPWVSIEGKSDDAQFHEYPEKSLADWHAERGYRDP
jgi:hypothetical protein